MTGEKQIALKKGDLPIFVRDGSNGRGVLITKKIHVCVINSTARPYALSRSV